MIDIKSGYSEIKGFQNPSLILPFLSPDSLCSYGIWRGEGYRALDNGLDFV